MSEDESLAERCPLSAPKAVPFPLRRRLEAERWSQVAAAVGPSTIVGAVYSYALLSHPMKVIFHLTQAETTWVASAAWALAMLNLPAGIALDHLGPRIVNVTAFTAIAVGFWLLALQFHLAATDHPTTSTHAASMAMDGAQRSVAAQWGTAAPALTPHWWRVPALVGSYGLLCWAASFLDPGLLLSNLSLFLRARGEVVIIQKTFMGLGASVFATWYTGFFGAEDSAAGMARYYFFVGCCAALFGAVAGIGVRRRDDGRDHTTDGAVRNEGPPCPEDLQGLEEGQEGVPQDAVRRWLWRTVAPPKAVVRAGFAMLAVTITYLTVAAGVHTVGHAVLPKGKGFGPHHDKVLPRWADVAVATGAALCLCVFLALPVVAWRAMGRGRSASGRGGETEEEDAAVEVEGGNVTACRWPTAARPVLTSLRTVDFWLLWFALLGVWGSGAVVTSSSAQMYMATEADCRHYDSRLNAAFTVCAGIGSSLGRVAAGLLERHLGHRAAPTAFLWLPLLLLAVDFGLIAAAPLTARPVLLVLPFTLHGFAYGLGWGAAVLAITALYPGESRGRHYGALATAGVVGIPLLTQGVVAPLYHRAHPERGGCCQGFDCYGPSSLLLSLLCLMCCGSALLLHRRFKQRFVASVHDDAADVE